MKTIGLIGGMSWESTAIYYQKLNQNIARALGGLHSAKIQMISFDFFEIAELQKNNDWDKAGAMIADAASRLLKSGAEVILLCTNTMHKVADHISPSTPLLHICDSIADQARLMKISRVGLLATRFTMEESFYVERLARRGLHVVLPNAQEQQEVHRIIFDELCRGQVSPQSKEFLLGVARSLQRQGIEGLLLGCTELGMSLQQNDLADLPLLDSTELHCKAASELSLMQSVR